MAASPSSSDPWSLDAVLAEVDSPPAPKSTPSSVVKLKESMPQEVELELSLKDQLVEKPLQIFAKITSEEAETRDSVFPHFRPATSKKASQNLLKLQELDFSGSARDEERPDRADDAEIEIESLKDEAFLNPAKKTAPEPERKKSRYPWEELEEKVSAKEPSSASLSRAGEKTTPPDRNKRSANEQPDLPAELELQPEDQVFEKPLVIEQETFDVEPQQSEEEILDLRQDAFVQEQEIQLVRPLEKTSEPLQAPQLKVLSKQDPRLKERNDQAQTQAQTEKGASQRTPASAAEAGIDQGLELKDIFAEAGDREHTAASAASGEQSGGDFASFFQASLENAHLENDQAGSSSLEHLRSQQPPTEAENSTFRPEFAAETHAAQDSSPLDLEALLAHEKPSLERFETEEALASLGKDSKPAHQAQAGASVRKEAGLEAADNASQASSATSWEEELFLRGSFAPEVQKNMKVETLKAEDLVQNDAKAFSLKALEQAKVTAELAAELAGQKLNQDRRLAPKIKENLNEAEPELIEQNLTAQTEAERFTAQDGQEQSFDSPSVEQSVQHSPAEQTDTGNRGTEQVALSERSKTTGAPSENNQYQPAIATEQEESFDSILDFSAPRPAASRKEVAAPQADHEKIAEKAAPSASAVQGAHAHNDSRKERPTDLGAEVFKAQASTPLTLPSKQQQDSADPAFDAGALEERLAPKLLDLLYKVKHPVYIKFAPFLFTGADLMHVFQGKDLEVSLSDDLHAEIFVADESVAKVRMSITEDKKIRFSLQSLSL